jgi:outer membrane protein OmpA-like peptidoglycan-associated protein
MGNRRGTVIVCLVVLALLAAPGCVSKKLFRSNVEDTDGRVTAVESAVEDNTRQIADLKSSTDSKLASLESDNDKAMQLGNQAMSEAKAAQKTAQGKVIWSVTLSDDKVKFPFGKAQLEPEAISALDRLVSQVKNYSKALYIEVEGHTDNVGNEEFNDELGAERAEAVRNYLNENGGLPLHMMNTISYGENRPVADNSSKDGRAQNRRVVIRVLE